MDDIRSILEDSASTVRLRILTKKIGMEIFLPQLYPLVGKPDFRLFSDDLDAKALKKIREFTDF